MKYLFVVIVLFFNLSCASTEQRLRSPVVKLFGIEGGSCSGIRVKWNNKFYTISAAHCHDLAQSKRIQSHGVDKKLEVLKVLYEDPYADLLLLSNPHNEGVDLADNWQENEKVITMTHGSGKPAYKTEGELLNIEFVRFPLFTIYTPELLKQCNTRHPKYSIEHNQGVMELTSVCYMQYWGVWSTAKVVPGSSGGAVLNLDGKLVGIVSASNQDFSIFVTLEDIKRMLVRYKKRK